MSFKLSFTSQENHWSVSPPFSHDTIWPVKVISLWTKLFQFGSRKWKPTTLTDLYLNIRTTRQNICPFVCSRPWTTFDKSLVENQCLDTRVVFVCVQIKKETQNWGLTVPGISWWLCGSVCAITPVLLRITQLDLCAKGLWLLRRSVPQHWIITELAACSALRRSQMSTTSVQTGLKKRSGPSVAIVAEGREGQVKWG